MPVNIVRAAKGVSGPAYFSDTTAMNTAVSGSSFIAIVIMDTSDGVTFDVSDTIDGAASGNTWTLIDSINTIVGSRSHIYKCENGNGGTNHVFSISVSPTVYQSIVLLEIEGAASACVDQVDGWQQDPYSSTNYVQSGPVTTTQAIELLIGIMVGNTSQNPTSFGINSSASNPSSGWGSPVISEVNGANYWTFAIYQQRVTSTGNYSFAGTETGSPPTAVSHIVTIKEALPAGFRAWDYAPDVQQIFHNPR